MAKTIPIDKPPGDGKKKPRNWIKTAGIVSGVLWVAGIGGAFALKFVDLSPAGTHAQGDAHAQDAEHDGEDGETALGHVPAAPAGHDEHAGAVHGEDHGDHGKSAEAKDAHVKPAHGEDHAAAAPETHGKDSHAKPSTQDSHAEAAPEAHGKEPAHGDAHAKTEPKAAHGESPDTPHAEAAPGDSHGEAHAKAAPGNSHGEAHAKAEAKPAHGEAHAASANTEGQGSEEATDAPPTVTGPASEDERNAYRELAEIHAANGNKEKAVYPLRKLMVVAGKDVPLLSLATEVFLATGNYQEALNAARRALKYAAPGRVDLETAAAMARYRLGEVHEAMADAEAALKKHPKDLDLLTALGTMEIEQGPAHPHYGESLEKALKVKPDHVPALYQAGRKAQLEGDYRDAETLFRRVLKLDPKHAKAHGQLGTALYHLKKEEPARKEFELALKTNPKDYNTWFNLGEVLLSLAGKEARPDRIRALRTEALASYLKAVEWNPSHPEAHFRIGVILNGNAQFKEALRHLEVSRKSDGYHVPTLVQMAVAYEGLKRPDKAKASLEKALELDPEDKIVHLKLKLLSRSLPSTGA